MVEDLNNMREQHTLWLSSGGKEGARATLAGADLQGADLRYAELFGADLRGAKY